MLNLCSRRVRTATKILRVLTLCYTSAVSPSKSRDDDDDDDDDDYDDDDDDDDAHEDDFHGDRKQQHAKEEEEEQEQQAGGGAIYDMQCVVTPCRLYPGGPGISVHNQCSQVNIAGFTATDHGNSLLHSRHA